MDFGDILGANPGDPVSGAGGFFDGWGGMVKDTLGYALKSKIDAEFNYPHQIAQREIELNGEDGQGFIAGDVAKSPYIPWLIMGAVAVVAILVLKD